MIHNSKYCFTFVSAEQNQGCTSPYNNGHFLCPLNKGGGALRGSQKPSSLGEFSSVNATALFVGDNLNNFVMLNEPRTSESSPQPCPARSIINKLLLTDDLDELRHRLSRDFMQLLTGEPDEMERNRIMSDFNNIDLILETLERERK